MNAVAGTFQMSSFKEMYTNQRKPVSSLHSISQPPVHLCFARAMELIAHPKITQILSFSWGFSSKVAFCTP